MADDGVLQIGTKVNIGPLQTGMAQAQAAVKSALQNMSEAQAQFGQAAAQGNAQAVAALKGYESELQAAQNAVLRLAEVEKSETSSLRDNISARMAASAELRVLEGNLMGSTRAAGAFLSTLPGIGAAMQAAFPVFGVIALVSILAKAAEGVYSLKKAYDALDGAATKASTDAIIAGEKILSVAHESMSAANAMRILVGAGPNQDVTVQNASSKLKEIQYSRELKDAQDAVLEQGLTGAALQKQKVIDIQKEIGAAKEAKAQADALVESYRQQLEAQTKIETVVAGHSGVVRSQKTINTITDPKQIEAIQQQLKTAVSASEQFNHELDMMKVKLEGAQVKESHAGDKSAEQAAKIEADAQFRILLANGQRELEFQQKLTDSLTETWLKQERVEQEVARKQAEFDKEKTRQFVENRRLEAEAAREAVKGQEIASGNTAAIGEAMVRAQEATGAITALGAAKALAAIKTQEYTDKLKALHDELDAINSDVTTSAAQKAGPAQNIQNQISQLQGQQQVQGITSQSQINQQIAEPYVKAFDSINQNWLQLQNKLIFGTRNVGAAFSNFGVGILESVAGNFEKMALHAAESELKIVLAHTAGNEAKVASDTTAAAQTTAISALTALKQISHSAAVAAAGAYSALAGVPIIGPVIGAIAAAGTFAAVEALAAFETGGIIPNTGVALVHQGEAVLPAHLTNLLMNTANNSTTNSSASQTIHFHGGSDQFKRDLTRHSGHLLKTVHRGLRQKGSR